VSFWRHNVTWKTERFLAPERGGFWKNSGILQLRKMGLFWGHLCTLSEPDGLTYGSVAKPLTLKLIQYTKVQIFSSFN